MVSVAARCLGWVDAGDLQVLQDAAQGFAQVPGGVGRGQVHLVAPADESDCDRRGDGALADATLAHAHDQAVVLGRELVDQVGQWGVGEALW